MVLWMFVVVVSGNGQVLLLMMLVLVFNFCVGVDRVLEG
jgi:hypothetical protein